MEPRKLKNIVILILLVTNLFLLGFMAVRAYQSARYQEGVLTDTIQILAASGITLDRSLLPEDGDLPRPRTLSRDQELEHTSAIAVVGEDATATTQGPALTVYTGQYGTIQFRSTGDVSAILDTQAYPLNGQSSVDHASAFLSAMGVDARPLTVTEDSDGNTVVTLRQYYEGIPVFSCQFSLTYQNGALVAMSGRRLTGAPAVDPDSAPLSVATLLLRFRAGILETGDVFNAIVAITPGYELTSTLGSGARLVPVLRVTTDAGTAYSLNVLTAQLTTVS